MLREYSIPLDEPNTTDADTFYHLLELRAQAHPDDEAAAYLDPDEPKRRVWKTVRADEMLATVRKLAKGLLARGVAKGDRVVIFSATNYAWALTDFACSAIGAVTVPIYETDSAEQVNRIVRQTAPVAAFADTEAHWQILDQAGEELDQKMWAISFLQGGLQGLLEIGESVDDERLDAAIARVHADDVATIVYTSGSTGAPKGAELSYRNFIVTVRDGWKVLPDMLITPPNRLLLFLPLAHCFARYIEYVCVGGRGTVAYVPDAHHLLSDMRSFKPTYLLGVPRVFEKVYNAASQKAGAGFKGRFLHKAYAHYVEWSKKEQAGQGHTVSERVQHRMYESTIGDLIRDALGGSIHYLACGGAPLDTDLAHFFNGIDGITLIQGYGMTETAAPCLVNFEDRNRIGSVGLPGPGISVRLDDDDELLIKGPCVFKGYLDNPEKTRQAFTPDGWLRTGDLGAIDDDGFVYITGRKKDLIITAGGKNVSPIPMEQTLSQCEIISHAVVVGDKRPFISALVTLDPQMLALWLKKQHIGQPITPAEADSNPIVRACVQEWVDRANRSVSRAESIRKFVILPDDFSQEDGTMTPSMKVVRPKVLSRYADVIDHRIYTPKPGTQPGPSERDVLIDKVGENVRSARQSIRSAAASSRERLGSQIQALASRHGADSAGEKEADKTTEEQRAEVEHSSKVIVTDYAQQPHEDEPHGDGDHEGSSSDEGPQQQS